LGYLVIYYIFPRFGIFRQEKSGNPAFIPSQTFLARFFDAENSTSMGIDVMIKNFGDFQRKNDLLLKTNVMQKLAVFRAKSY
jgi:hypothetical protein